jgi:hypothetical protein
LFILSYILHLLTSLHLSYLSHPSSPAARLRKMRMNIAQIILATKTRKNNEPKKIRKKMCQIQIQIQI